MNIDLVYLWVDGNDPEWLKKKQRFTDKTINTVGRYQDNQELKYSLRSVEKHLPWVRKIFIVTDNQTPKFLNTNNPKIRVVDHSEIIPNEILPVFNSTVLEHFLYRIPDLSEHFLYANDDMFVNKNLLPSYFFKNGIPIVRMIYEPLLKWEIRLKRLLNININNYRLIIENAYRLFEKRFGIFYPAMPHHNIDAYLKSDHKKVVEAIFKEELETTFSNTFRNSTDIQRILFSYYAIVQERGILTYVNRKESCRIRVQKADYKKFLTKYNPSLFCLNDTEHATDEDRARIQPFLEEVYPVKAEFEKQLPL